jgi:exopolyphosphatase/guanosine-5'-triphosphate,3'-diphosphate pyrophosphatase
MIVADVVNYKIAKVLATGRGITRLSAGFAETKKLSPASIKKTLDLLKNFGETIEAYNVEKMLAVATSAVREAENSAAFLNGAKELGIDIKIISGDMEASYTKIGVLSHFAEIRDMVLFDIGGGSTEITLIKDCKTVYSQSTPVGVVKLCELFGFSNRFKDEIRQNAKRYIFEMLKEPFERARTFLSLQPECHVVGTAGTVATIAAYVQRLNRYDSAKISRFVLTTAHLSNILKELDGFSPEEILAKKNVEEGRQDLLLPGVVLTEAILEGFGCSSFTGTDCGLREGLVISLSQS